LTPNTAGATTAIDSTCAATPTAPASEADAVQRLDPRYISLTRTVSAIAWAVISALHLMAALVLLVLRGFDTPTLIVLGAWAPLTALLAWQTFRWPQIEYRYWRYRVSGGGIEIWSGVVWRQAVAVPRSRIQHIDVAQGPVERSYGLATVSVYTAGTEYSRVELPGLDHGVALALRDALLPRDDERAV
jgi:membrane protein YdbS with pleckstrin-like domain